MVDFAAAHGITKLETLNILDLSTPDPEIAKDLKAYADSKGISFPCVSVGLDLVGEDHQAAVEQVKQYAHIAKILGSPFLHHTIALNFSDPQLTADNFDLFYTRGLAAVREIFDYAKELGIRTIYEDQGFLFNGRENFARFLKEVDRNVGVVADFGNIQFADEDVEDFIPAFREQIVHVHVKDYIVSRQPGTYRSKGGHSLTDCPIGQGSVHMDAAFLALQKAGYRGIVSLECEPMGEDQEATFCYNYETVRKYMDTYL
jgi:sugar phosphate isomerase/epimerase